MQKKIILLYSLFLISLCPEVNAQEWPVIRQNYSQQQLNKLFLQALATLPDHKIPIEYQDLTRKVENYKCATVLLFEVRRNLDLFPPDQRMILESIFARPQLPLSYVNSTGQFRIHYAISGLDSVSVIDNNTNGVPDYIEEIAAALELSFQKEVTEHGYRLPPDDADVDGPEYDIYIEALGRGLYGETFAEAEVAETSRRDFRSYMRIDNDFGANSGYFTTGVDGARVTIAHEFLHAIQFGYRIFETNDEIFYYELSSIWMEDVVYDDINDYFQYIGEYYETRDTPFNKFTFSNLGNALWNHFLEKKFDDLNLLRRPWEIMETGILAMESIDRSLRQQKNTTFANEYAEFAVWNYFTGLRANSVDFFEEGQFYPGVMLSDSLALDMQKSVSGSSQASTFKYYKFKLTDSGAVSITGTAENPENWKFGIIIVQPDNSTDWFIRDDFSAGIILGCFPTGSEIIVVPTNTTVLEGELLSLANSTLDFNFEVQIDPSECTDLQGITGVYPNPFFVRKQGDIFFEFGAISAEDFEVQIFTADGRVIKSASLDDGSGTLTASEFRWDGRDNQNRPVASGIYIFQLKQDGFVQFRKFAVIQE